MIPEVFVPVNGSSIAAFLQLPASPKGLILFAHGSGSGRHSPRNQFVASGLRDAGLATMLLDLLTSEEERVDQETAELRFDIDLLTSRIVSATRWARERKEVATLPYGYFGASTGAAAALDAAAALPGDIAAVVSRGGRPDLAGRLGEVAAATLLIVGGADPEVLALNRRALKLLRCERELLIVPGATHLFEEPGKLARVTEAAAAWFLKHLRGSKA